VEGGMMMYQTVGPVMDKSRSPELQQNELSTLILNELFSGEINARSIIRDQVKKLPADKIASYTACLKVNLEPVTMTLKVKDEAKNFRNAYARVRYILAIPDRYIAW